MEQKNILNFFVAQDTEGQPRQLEVHLIPESANWMALQLFTDFLRKQRELYRPSLSGSYLPDLSLCQYQFPRDVPCPENFRIFDRDKSLVGKYIADNGGIAQNVVSLRGLEYLYSRDEEKSLSMLVSNRLINHLLVQPEAKRFARSQDVFHDDPSETLTAIETSQGVLLFEYSGYGRACYQSYLQYLADHYFTIEGQKPGFINQYIMTNPGKEAMEAFRASGNAFSLYNACFLPDNARYQDVSILQNVRQDRSFRIEPDSEAYQNLVSRYDLTTNIPNAQILRLLSLKESGRISGIDDTTRRIPFMYKMSFNALFNKLENTPAENKAEQKKIKGLICEQADYILKRDYELFSREALNKKTDPIFSIQTSKGAVYLPVTEEGAIYKQCYLQYLADRFFTPEVQALGRIREFYISSPNPGTEHYMQKHLDLFRSNPFYGQLAKMPLYPIEQSELLKKGGYPIEPTYHAFKQFTEDYQLSVTPENAEIFTLLFIREYGLPADFNTNESYKEFTHKGNFKPLDQEMSELQSQKGYSERTFYNIQNRQQQLADKILGLEYKLACPPLQLTGPAASEKKKTVSRLNKPHNPRI